MYLTPPGPAQARALWVKDILRSLLPKVLQLYVHVPYVFALFVDPPSLQWCSLSCVPLWPDIWQTPRLSPRRLRRPSLYDICAICYLPRKYGRSIEEHTFSELLKTRLHLEPWCNCALASFPGSCISATWTLKLSGCGEPGIFVTWKGKEGGEKP